MNFGDLVSKEIYVKLKDDSKLDYFIENGYFDYRVGCDLCENMPQPGGFKTNFLEILNKNDYFSLSNLSINKSNKKINIYYNSNNKLVIYKLYKVYKNYHNINIDYKIKNIYDLNSKEYIDTNKSFVESNYFVNKKDIFISEANDSTNSMNLLIEYWDNKIKDQDINHLQELNNISICSNCYKPLIATKKIKEDDFKIFNPLIKFYCYFLYSNFDLLIFKNENDKNLIYKYLYGK